MLCVEENGPKRDDVTGAYIKDTSTARMVDVQFHLWKELYLMFASQDVDDYTGDDPFLDRALLQCAPPDCVLQVE